MHERPFVRLRVVMEGVQITDEDDVERAFLRRSARKAVAGSLLLAAGFIFLLISRLTET
jgi:hypothetical protein